MMKTGLLQCPQEDTRATIFGLGSPDQWTGNCKHLKAQHAQRRLEQHQGALVEEQVPDAQQQSDVHHAGEGREEPVQCDQRQLCQ